MSSGAQQRLLNDVLGELAISVEQAADKSQQRRSVLVVQGTQQVVATRLRIAHDNYDGADEGLTQ
jgi:hypothetical protein